MRIMPATLFLAMLFVFLTFTLNASSSAWAADGELTFETSEQETQYRTLIDEFRCPKCQNANLAGSDAPIAQDLKNKTYELVKQGQSNDQIREYMISRYGDFISYKPPIKRSTWLLWFAPPVILVLALMIWFFRACARRTMRTAPLSAEESWRLNQLLDGEIQSSQKEELRDDR
jgi:cytochrome c-type biogenesis protein CcmH